MKDTMEPTERMRHIFDEHVSHYGDPDLQFEFGQGGNGYFHRLDVFVWLATNDLPMTTFSTLGMADRPMPGVAHRCEMHWTIRGTLKDTDLSNCSFFLSKLAEYPFFKSTALDHWHIIKDLEIPAFSECAHILFHPSFVPNGWDNMDWNGETIKILNLVPLTHDEYRQSEISGIPSMLDRLYNSRIDIFSNRPSS